MSDEFPACSALRRKEGKLRRIRYIGNQKEKVVTIEILRYKELSVSDIWSLIKEVPDFVQYFLDYKANQIPSRKFMFNIVSTFRFEEIIKMVQIARKNRSAKSPDDENDLVHITKQLYDEIKAVASHKCKDT